MNLSELVALKVQQLQEQYPDSNWPHEKQRELIQLHRMLRREREREMSLLLTMLLLPLLLVAGWRVLRDQ